MNVTGVSQTRWGKARFGGGSAALWSISIGIGAITSAGLGWLFLLLGDVERPVLAFTITLASTLPVTTALGWAVLVDRSTLKGAIEKPDDSIESSWYQKAAVGAFGDILIIGGLGAAVFAFTKIEAPISWCLAAVVLFAMVDFAGRYAWQKKSVS
ncbi:hypothetical protein [Arthrobacter sp. GMC3]|uniref:hypothetical protein n=1 Tax=Arthrobacter sp. GMC3 TaxID=2058894 RepID=UPI000CE38B48|nr:hypothetical protein [Arthrobacter sp. GMC3]